jgi:hypothetical protein
MKYLEGMGGWRGEAGVNCIWWCGRPGVKRHWKQLVLTFEWAPPFIRIQIRLVLITGYDKALRFTTPSLAPLLSPTMDFFTFVGLCVTLYIFIYVLLLSVIDCDLGLLWSLYFGKKLGKSLALRPKVLLNHFYLLSSKLKQIHILSVLSIRHSFYI